MEPDLAELEQLLCGARPQPHPEFVRELEMSLVRSLSRRRRRRLLPDRAPGLRLSMGIAAALATVALALSLAGALPLRIGGAPEATAERECRTVTEWRLERTPRLSFDRRSVPRLRYTTEMRPRFAVRCH
jgi:hypothetical protein